MDVRFFVALLVMMLMTVMTTTHAENGSSDAVFAIPRLERAAIVADQSAWGIAGFHVALMPNAAGQVKPPADFDASFRMAWNDAGLLLLVQVRDDDLIEADGVESIWSRDSIEVFYGSHRGGEYVHAMVSPGVTETQKAVRTYFNPKVKAAIPNLELAITVARKKITGGYIAELLLPWKNLNVTPKLGDEIVFQLMVNDFDVPRIPTFSAVWFPASDTSRNSSSMYRVRLSTEASPTVGSAAMASYADFESIHVQIAAGEFAAGKRAQVLAGEKAAGEAPLVVADGRASAEFSLPMPPLGGAAPTLTIKLDGQLLKTITLPDASDARMRAYLAQKIIFQGFCFGSRTFPECKFERPELIERLIGPYSITRKFYDSRFAPVESANQPGRYAAVVEIKRGARTDRRFFTLFRYDEKFKPGSDAVFSKTTPDEFQINEGVLKRHSVELEHLSGRAMPEVLMHDPNAAVLFASLHDLSAAAQTADGQGKVEPIRDVDRRWWMRFKRSFYGYDKRYTKAIECPSIFTGKAAAVLHEGTATEAGMTDTATAEILASCEEWASQSPEPFNLCVARRGVIFAAGGYGKLKGEAATRASRMGTASTTKFLAATLMMELVDQGLVKLDDTIDQYIPALNGIEPSHKLTVRELYLHTTGLPENWGDFTNDIEELTAAYYPLVKNPEHHYQPTGLALGGKIVEMISGELHPDFYRKHLLDPLGCKDTDCGSTSGGALTTADDLAKVAQMMLNGGAYGNMRFLREDSVRQMTPLPGRDRIGPDPKIRWGIGSKLYDSDKLSAGAMGHPGSNGSFIFIDPDRELLVTMTRTDEGKDYLEHRAKLMSAIFSNMK